MATPRAERAAEESIAASAPQRPAVDALYREHRVTVARWAARLGGPAVDTADVVQEVFLIVHRKLPAYRPEAKVTTWLFQITDRVVRHHRRRGRWLKKLLSFGKARADDIPDRRPTALAALEQGEARARVYAVLDRLPERHRSALILFELEGLSGEEVAERLDAKLATVWVWLHRGRADFIRRFLESEARDG